ncbi:MAG: type IX secretion system sortase PorU [Bacteroidetes bacterium]|nr:type IX secretion system sortase PorU [Bacteroidota bacterium]
MHVEKRQVRMLKSMLMTVVGGLLLLFTAAGQDLRILSMDESGVTLEYRPAVTRTAVASAGSVFTFDGATALDVSHAREPDLRFRKELLALPGLRGHRIEILQVDYRDIVNVHIAPVPGYRRIGDALTETFTPGACYELDSMLPQEIAVLEQVGIIRDRVVGDLLLSPVQWNPATATARVYARIRFRVQFGPRDSDVVNGDFRDETIPEVLNVAQASQWKYVHRVALPRGSADVTLATGTWYRIDVQQTGIYRLDRRWFIDAGIDVSGVDPRTIRLFGSGGRERPQQLGAPGSEPLREIAIEVFGGEDGRFDEADFVQFYAQGLSGFSWNAASRRYDHYIHRYDDVNSYLLTFGGVSGKRITGETALNETGAYEPRWFIGREFEEEEAVNVQNSGKLWVGKRLVPGAGSASAAVYTRKLHGLVQEQPVLYRMQLVSSSEVSNSFSIRANDTPLGMVDMLVVDFGADTGDMAKLSGIREFTGSGQLADERSMLSITYSASPADRARGGYVDWVEWQYARRFEPLNDELLFSAPDTTAVIQFVLNGFSTSDIVLYDVTDDANVRRIVDAQISGGTVRFQIRNTEGNPRQFLAVAAPALKTAAGVAGITNSPLMASGGAEHLIITHASLIPAAERLKAHRERGGDEFISSMVIPMEWIYNEFNYGVTDPTAIRDFLAWAMENWSVQPRYVLFFGDGHYDYRNFTTTEPILVPVWETENSTSRINSYATDDYYAKVVGTDSRVDLATGRIPVLTIDEANLVVDKIIRYESDPDFDPWKNHVTFVADDGWTTYRDTDLQQHTSQSEELSALIPSDIEQKKIYIVSYRTEITTQGRTKPDAFRGIIDQVNDGTLILNYTGHGAHDIWAHERIFDSDISIPQFTNSDRLTFVSAATCTFGLYDAPELRSGTELMLLHENGGAIGGLSAPRVVFSTENSAFNKEFFRHLLVEGREEDGRAKRIGDAISSAKQRYFGVAGYEKFHLFADPALRLALPRYRATVERVLINGLPITGDTLQLRALSTVTIEGSVRTAAGDVWSAFTGTLELRLFDAERRVIVQDTLWRKFTYTMPGGLLYRGQATIANGRFTVEFIVPKDISYEDRTGRISMYFDNGETDGAGFFSDLRVGGSDSTVTPDTEGPVVELFMDARTFRSGDETGTDPLLIADLFDESGINTTGLGIGHDIEIWLDDTNAGIVLNAHYKGDIDSYQRGTVEYRLRDLAPGPHVLRLRAWDIFNNSTTVQTPFTVVGGLSLQDVANFPNPIVGGTTFTFRHNVLDPLNVDVLIYSTAGRLERHIRREAVTARVVDIPWDGRSMDGVPLGTGMYIYRIVCRTADGTLGSEASGKILVVR